MPERDAVFAVDFSFQHFAFGDGKNGFFTLVLDMNVRQFMPSAIEEVHRNDDAVKHSDNCHLFSPSRHSTSL